MRECSVCHEKDTKTVAALGHNYSDEWTVDKEATCEDAGSMSHHCVRCGEKSDVTEIPATGHNFYNMSNVCSTCGNIQGTESYLLFEIHFLLLMV